MASRWNFVLAVTLCVAAAGCGSRGAMSSGLTHDSVLAKAGLHNYWQLDLKLPPGEKVTKLTRIEENLYCLTTSNFLLAVDAASGVRKWSRKVADDDTKVFPPCHGAAVPIDPNHIGVDKVRFPPAPEQLTILDLVLINTADYVLAIDRKTDEEIRKIQFGAHAPSSFVANTGGDCDGEFFYVGTTNGEIQAIRINEQVVTWSYPAGSIMTSAPRCYAPGGISRVYVAGGDGDYFILKAGPGASALWPPLGSRQWSAMAGASVAGFHVDDRAAFMPCVNQRVYAFSLSGGDPIWWFTTKGQLVDDIQVSENSVFQYARGDRFYAIDPTSGKKRWSLRQGRRVLAAMPSKNVPTAYLVDSARNLLVVDEILGKIQVSIPLTGVNLFADNTSASAIYIGNTDGRLVCLRNIGADNLTADELKKSGTGR